MSAIVPIRGPIRQLDARAEQDEQVTEDLVADPPRLTKLLGRTVATLARLRRRFAPHHLDFENVTVDATGTTKYRFPHGLSGQVRYWPVAWTGASSPNLVLDASTDNNTLVLTSTSDGVVTLRIEEAG